MAMPPKAKQNKILPFWPHFCLKDILAYFLLPFEGGMAAGPETRKKWIGGLSQQQKRIG
jgi:hypothetical protein